MDSELISTTLQGVLQVLHDVPVSNCTTEIEPLTLGVKFHPQLWLYNLTAQNCLFILSEVSEMGVRQDAQDFLEKLISSIALTNETKCVNNLFFESIWPAIRYGIQIKNESFRYSFISLIKSVILELGKTPRFIDIAPLVLSELDQMNFFDNMLSLTTAFNSKGLRQLVRFLSHTSVSAQNLKEILLPMVLHRIELISQHYEAHNNKNTLTHAQRESLSSSFDALAAVAKQLPPNLYENLVSEHMSKLDRGFNVELVIKTLIGLLNGYNNEASHDFMITVLHRLEKHLSKRVASENRHKKAQKSAPVDLMDQKNAEWTLRGMALQVPVALAIMNIAVKLPKKHLKELITKVVLRICDFLKAKEPEVRKEAGATLLKIIEIINVPEEGFEGNVRYLPFITQTVKSHLDRGFQKHVALYTCHRVLQGLHDKHVFDRLSIDFGTVKNMSELYLDELFGDMAKEKLERSTAEKGIVPEAKKVKAFEGLRLLGNIIDKSLLLDFIKIIVDASNNIRNQSNLQKMQQIFEGLQSPGGMMKNPRLDAVSLFTLSMLLLRDNAETLFSSEKGSKMVVTTKKQSSFDDMHIYVPAQRLDGYETPMAPTNIRSASHLIINCGLNFMHGLSKMYHSSAEIDVCAMIDPAVEYVLKILNNVQHKAILFSAVKCLKEIIRVNPPSLANRVPEVCDLLFKLLNRNSLSNDAQDKIGESLTTVFNKAMAQFLQRVDIRLTANQYQVLLLSAQVDSLNIKRQMTSFLLLRALIENRIKEPTKNENVVRLSDEIGVQISDIIGKVKNIAILSPNERTRTESRSTIATYLKHFRQSKEYIQETIVFLLKQLTINEDGALSACLIIQNIFKIYSSEEIGAAAVSSYVVAFVVMAMQEGVTEKVEKVFTVLVSQIMYAVDSDQQNVLCNMVIGYIDKYGLDSKKFRIAFYLISDMLKILQITSRVTLAKKLVDSLMEKFPLLIGNVEKLNTQLAACQGQDADLMNYLETIVVPSSKKQKLDVEDSEDEEKSTEEVDEIKQEVVQIEKNEELSEKINIIMGNINGGLSFISSLLCVDSEVEEDASVLIHLIQSGSRNGIWHIIIKKLMCNKHSTLRLNATKNVIQKILTLELRYDNETVSSIATEEIVNMIIEALYSQLKNEQISQDECNTVLVNLLLLWQIVLNRFPVAVKSDLCKRMMDNANFIAKKELLSNCSLIRRCAVLKFLVGICSKTSSEDLTSMKLEKSILYMCIREERQSQDENAANKKKTNKRKYKSIESNCSPNEILEWKNLVVSVAEVIRNTLGEDNCKRLTTFINKDRAANKLKRINEESALAVSNQGESLAKKMRKSKK